MYTRRCKSQDSRSQSRQTLFNEQKIALQCSVFVWLQNFEAEGRWLSVVDWTERRGRCIYCNGIFVVMVLAGCVLLLFSVSVPSAGESDPVDEKLRHRGIGNCWRSGESNSEPLITAQVDGVVFENWNAASLYEWHILDWYVWVLPK